MKRSTGTPVNLLPLLDVLLCTMGTLIVVLGVLNRLARTHSVAEQQEQIATAREQITLRIEEVTKARDRTSADLELARRKLSGIEDHSRQLADKLQSLKSAGKQLATDKADDQREALRRQLVELNEQHAKLDKDLQAARVAKVQKKLMFSVVPFDGVYKTNRRPIYIECRSDVIILQPEGIVFTPADFSGPPGPGNPLAAALRATQEYSRQIPPPGPDVSNEPYPLLLVRPDGIIAYYLARDAMSSWNAEFGYELISADGKFEFPIQPEARLAEMERRAVDESRKRLQWLAQVSPEAFDHNKQKVQYRVSAIRGGLVRDGAPSLGNDPFAHDPLGGFGRSPVGNATGSGNSDSGPNGNGLPNGNPVADGRGGSALGNGGRGNSAWDGGDGVGPGGGSANGGLGGAGGTGDKVFGNGARMSEQSGGGYAASPFGNGGQGTDGSGNGAFANGAPGTSTNNNGGFKNGGTGFLTGASGGSLGGTANGAGQEQSSLVGPRYAGTGGGDLESQGSQPGGAGEFHSQLGAGGAGSQAGGPMLNAPGLAGATGGSGGTFGSGSMAGNSSSQSGGSKSSGNSSGGTNSLTGGGSSADGDGTEGSGSSSSGGAAASASQMGQAGSAGSGETSQMSSGIPTPSMNFTANQQRTSRNLSKERGRNWAIQPATSSVPITRPVRVECWNDRLVIVPDATDQQPQVIPMADRTDEAVDQLVAAVRVHTQSWGLAGHSMYWKPQLMLDVKPNAESRAADLQVLMAESGLDVKRK